MKNFCEWMKIREVSRPTAAGIGFLLGGPLGAAIGYGLGSDKKPSVTSDPKKSASQPRGHSDDAKQDHEELKRRGVIEGEVIEDKVNKYGEREITYRLFNGVRITKIIGRI